MSDDRVRLHVEASVVLVSSSLVFLWKFCTEDVYWRPEASCPFKVRGHVPPQIFEPSGF